MITHTGGCHCGRVRFEVVAPAHLEVADCNCSICSKAGYLHLFCSVCGIKSLYVPRSHPDGFSVNARCLDEGTVTGLMVTPSDGRDWERQYPDGRAQWLEASTQQEAS